MLSDIIPVRPGDVGGVESPDGVGVLGQPGAAAIYAEGVVGSVVGAGGSWEGEEDER